MSAPETSASLHGRRAGFQSALNTALLAGQPTQKLRQQITDIDGELAARAAGQATAAAYHERRAAVMAAFQIPEEQPMVPDTTIDDAAQDLASCDAELAVANAILTTAQAHEARITGQIKTLEGERQAIIARRAEGDQRATDGTKLAELVADIEGLGFMVPEADAGLKEAPRAVTERSAARQRAVAELGRVEKATLAAARRERLDELAPIMVDILLQDRADRKPTHAKPDWVAPPELLRELQMRAADRPDLATGGMPGSRFPASAAYRPALRAI